MFAYRTLVSISAILILSACGSSTEFTGGTWPHQYEVALQWRAPTSSADPVVGYNVYRSVNGGAYALLNSTRDTSTTYSDHSVQDGITYEYYVESVDAQNNQSGPSNIVEETIPSSESAALKVPGVSVRIDPATGARVIVLPAHPKKAS